MTITGHPGSQLAGGSEFDLQVKERKAAYETAVKQARQPLPGPLDGPSKTPEMVQALSFLGQHLEEMTGYLDALEMRLVPALAIVSEEPRNESVSPTYTAPLACQLAELTTHVREQSSRLLRLLNLLTF